MELQIIKHNDILFRDLLRGIAVKNVAWPHPIESQVKWIIDNMYPEDYHVFLKEDGKDKAYMTLSHVKGEMNGSETVFWGVGCVCTSSKGKGYGGMLLKKTNQYLLDKGVNGLLFCKKQLIPFYEKYDWKVVPQNRVIIPEEDSGVYTMVYNCPEIERLKYSGRMF